MSTLILTCDTGEGHNSCAKAIKERYDAHGQECEIINPVQFVSERFSEFVTKVHIVIYRKFPNLFRVGYAYVNSHSKFTAKGSLPYNILARGVDQLYAYILEKQNTSMICVHLLLMMMVSALQDKYAPECLTAFVATDYTRSPGLTDSNPDFCFIPDASLLEEFTCTHIDVSRIIPVGIPVRKQFYEKTDKTLAKKKLGISETADHILMMCGSMGCGPLEEILELLSKHSGFHITVVCGNNKELHGRLAEKYARNQSVHIQGFVSNMSELMDSAELFVTKPGGLSSTEAAVKHLPAVYINTVGGCENNNLHFFTERGCAVAVDTASQAVESCLRFIRDAKIRKRMETMIDQFPVCDAAEAIWKTMEGAAHGR